MSFKNYDKIYKNILLISDFVSCNIFSLRYNLKVIIVRYMYITITLSNYLNYLLKINTVAVDVGVDAFIKI